MTLEYGPVLEPMVLEKGQRQEAVTEHSKLIPSSIILRMPPFRQLVRQDLRRRIYSFV